MIVLILIILIALPAFFGAGEVSLLRLRPSRVQGLIEEKKPGALSIHRLQRRLRRALMVWQLGGTLSLIAIGWLGNGLSQAWWPSINFPNRIFDILLFVGLVLISTLLAGILPKALVLNRPESAALRLAPLLEAVMRALGPLLALLEAIASLLLRLLGLTAKWDALVPALSAGELETLIETGGVTGLRPDERNILEGVFALHDTQVREVMVPRSGMVTLPVTVSFSELMKNVHQTKHARFVVIGESLDDVRGVIDLRQLAEPISRGEMQADSPLEKFLQPAARVLETCTLAELLPTMKNGKPFLIVVDEHGGTEGLVTAADLTGEIVGEELDSTHEIQANLQQEEGQPNKWLLAGDLEIIELNRQLNLELPEANDHHTLAGFLLEKLQHIPSVGESLSHANLKFEITSMKGPRIEQVRLILQSIDPAKN
ncbi:hemolysin family protein [Prochlorococcus sp. MIT 1341]|uniref:hemolysin family protein n=1 Tax=Prochlorococcus sp. MIT 1341 TaxID=3096221 RepID=UPI002A74F4A8|nr:hemolysin family protein [Prochlorococcus sp. MIT 1341]